MTESEWWLTEAEWLSEPATYDLIEFLADIGSERKLRLFAHACCQRIEHLLVDPRSRAALVAVAQYADATCGRDELCRHYDGAMAAKAAIEAPLVRDGCLYATAESTAATAVLDACNPTYSGACRQPYFRTSTVGCAANAAVVAVGSVAYDLAENRSDCEAAQDSEAATQAILLRDIFGNPFRPTTIDRVWTTPSVISLAQAAYDENLLPAGALDPARLAVLSDALEEAGCTDEAILSHLRSPGPHVRGCWAIDLILGKQ